MSTPTTVDARSTSLPTPSPIRRRRSALLAVAVIATLSILGVSCVKNGEAAESYDRINAERRAHGLPTLSMNQDLINKAQTWAEHMAATGTISHSVLSQGAPPGWRSLGENVGMAGSVAQMHQLFMNSRAHAANILQGGYNKVGTGVAERGGRLYVVQVFAS